MKWVHLVGCYNIWSPSYFCYLNSHQVIFCSKIWKICRNLLLISSIIAHLPYNCGTNHKICCHYFHWRISLDFFLCSSPKCSVLFLKIHGTSWIWICKYFSLWSSYRSVDYRASRNSVIYWEWYHITKILICQTYGRICINKINHMLFFKVSVEYVI